MYYKDWPFLEEGLLKMNSLHDKYSTKSIIKFIILLWSHFWGKKKFFKNKTDLMADPYEPESIALPVI